METQSTLLAVPQVFLDQNLPGHWMAKNFHWVLIKGNLRETHSWNHSWKCREQQKKWQEHTSVQQKTKQIEQVIPQHFKYLVGSIIIMIKMIIILTGMIVIVIMIVVAILILIAIKVMMVMDPLQE